jgi:murein DD-endopeptidase MepM/ murein hydrolase activator NlpD
MSLCTCIAPALARGAASGGVQAPSVALAGGAEYGVSMASSERPVLSRLNLPAAANVGRPPRMKLRIDEAGVATVHVGVLLVSLATRKAVLTANMGWVHAGRTLTVSWPPGATLGAGSYQVRLSVHDHNGATLVRGAHDAAEASLTITSPSKAKTAPSVPVAGTPPPASVPTPAQSAAAGAVFPVAGPHNFGGPENRFGAPRGGYMHEGQDVLTAEGTPVLAPMAGAILTTSYQAAGAGYYAVEHTGVGFDFMFAHCQAGSLAVVAGQAVAAGRELCRAGQTGDATAPHLHFEMWVGGWQAAGGYPIDPLPYLEAWDHAGTAG